MVVLHCKQGKSFNKKTQFELDTSPMATTDRQTERQTDRQTERQTDRQTKRQTNTARPFHNLGEAPFLVNW